MSLPGKSDADPMLESAMAGLVLGKTFGQVFPPSATSQDRENANDHFAGVLPSPTARVFLSQRFCDERAMIAHCSSVNSALV
jgi:hypothetical protein